MKDEKIIELFKECYRSLVVENRCDTAVVVEFEGVDITGIEPYDRVVGGVAYIAEAVLLIADAVAVEIGIRLGCQLTHFFQCPCTVINKLIGIL